MSTKNKVNGTNKVVNSNKATNVAKGKRSATVVINDDMEPSAADILLMEEIVPLDMPKQARKLISKEEAIAKGIIKGDAPIAALEVKEDAAAVVTEPALEVNTTGTLVVVSPTFNAAIAALAAAAAVVPDAAALVAEIKPTIDWADYDTITPWLQAKVKEGKVIRKNNGKPFVGEVNVKFYADKGNRLAYVFTTHYGKRENKAMTQDYWWNVLTQYVTILD